MPIANRPLVEHIVRWLEAAGVEEVFLLTQYRAAAFDAWLRRRRGIPIRAIEEPVPLGTAGAVANVARFLHTTTAVINGDNVTDVDLDAMARAHRATGALATIAVDRVADVTGRGVVVAGSDGRVGRFQEKPAPGMALADTVNTGTYLIEPAALAGMTPGEPAMWETNVFPALIEAGKPVYAFNAPHLWLDAGTPEGYFAAQRAILEGSVSTPAGKEAHGIWTEPNVLEDSAATYHPPISIGFGSIVAAGAALLGPLSLGAECHILSGAHVEASAIWDHCMVEPGAIIKNSIIGYNCYVAERARVEGALLGDGVIVRAGGHVTPGSRLAPGSVVEAV
jgi:NDP-sugar pyrophosphorylase family protein